MQEMWERQKSKSDRRALLDQTEVLANFAKIYEVTGNLKILKYLNLITDNLIPDELFQEEKNPMEDILSQLEEKLTPEQLEEIKKKPVINEDKSSELEEMPDGLEVEFPLDDPDISELSDPEVVDLDSE